MYTEQDHDFSPPTEKGLPMTPFVFRPNSKLAIISLIMGIMGITVLPLVGSLIAIVTGHAAMGEIRESEGRLAGKQMAKGALWLGYGFVGLVLVAITLGLLLLFRFGPPSLQELNRLDPATINRHVGQERGVKMVNEMDRGDFQLIEESKVDASPREIIACYNAGMPRANSEFALVTTKKLIYLKDGRTTVFDLKELKSLKDDTVFRNFYHLQSPDLLGPTYNVYLIEATSQQGQRMRISIASYNEGSIFFDALNTAAKEAGAHLSPN